jgi:hypothetical protein
VCILETRSPSTANGAQQCCAVSCKARSSAARTSTNALDGTEENTALELCVLGWPLACEQAPSSAEVSAVQLKALRLVVPVKLVPSRLGRSRILSSI